MNKPIYETIKSYGDNLETTTTKIIVGYERVTRNGFSRKKKPISMIKALEVRDRITKRDNLSYSGWDNNVDYIGGLIYLDGKVLPGVSKATIKSVQDNTGLTVVDLTLYANNHKR
ncbi:hypothetical protein EFN92_10290 [Lactococcus lactis]|jgi:hypothetical protein|uniref:Uncharacterized protein n=1 Tax=Lactococcus lactis TaxID=1358 RepID=A0AAW5TQV1_9LACT|nr:hypothetical protein [Lactococcus lactis]MCT3093019.1 hypothetical protein [Lactococcus lactis]MCW2281722.1 hypothetical protein [Lactococcus lactis]